LVAVEEGAASSAKETSGVSRLAVVEASTLERMARRESWLFSPSVDAYREDVEARVWWESEGAKAVTLPMQRRDITAEIFMVLD
jgi:hypothetical protein